MTTLILENSKQSVSLASLSFPWFHFCHFLLPWVVMRKSCSSNSSVPEGLFSLSTSSGSWRCWEMDLVRISGLCLSLGFYILLSHSFGSLSPIQQKMSERFHLIVWKSGVHIGLRFILNIIPREEYFAAPVSLVDAVPKRRSTEPKFGVSGGSSSSFSSYLL